MPKTTSDAVRNERIDWPTLIGELTACRDLSIEAARWAGTEIVTGSAGAVVMAGFLAALRTKGETEDELYGLVLALLEHGRSVAVPPDSVDIAGTGGDGTGLFNVSTLAAITAAGAGLRVVKHGGRAASSRTAGSADLAEGLGLSLDLTPEQAEAAAVRSRFTYLFAPQFNPGLRHAVDARRQLGIPTVFNLAAPLLNPAHPRSQVIGVADRTKAPVIAGVLARLGRSGIVVSSRDGLDKASTMAPSDLWIVGDGEIAQAVVDPSELGIAPAALDQLRGADAVSNARDAQAILAGGTGPRHDIVTLNAALLLCAATLTPSSVASQLVTAMDCAREALDSGAARAALEEAITAMSTGLSAEQAPERLQRHDGFLRAAIEAHD